MGHPGMERLATYTGDPLGVDARHILDDLATKDRLVGWLLALVVELNQRRTTGGLPVPYTHEWRNPVLPVRVHSDYKGI